MMRRVLDRLSGFGLRRAGLRFSVATDDEQANQRQGQCNGEHEAEHHTAKRIQFTLHKPVPLKPQKSLRAFACEMPHQTIG